jgi:subtilase family serine protease
LPDLEIASKLFYPRSITNGDIVTVSVQIRNIGDISANDMAIVFYVDGREMHSKTLTRLERGRLRLITYTWQAPAGKHELKIKIDPEDNIVEKREDNNDGSSMVEVKESGFLGITSIREVCSIIAIIIVILIIVLIITTIKRKGSFFGLKPGIGK